jgi:hypothetical protein
VRSHLAINKEKARASIKQISYKDLVGLSSVKPSVGIARCVQVDRNDTYFKKKWRVTVGTEFMWLGRVPSGGLQEYPNETLISTKGVRKLLYQLRNHHFLKEKLQRFKM